ncbi:uncharacterized protein HD556DRAFT_1445176 [Suillus plorans]|uniref:Heterokaryon incompatibility domain-containing protein n=1 Tax=Suillus plorans TaxID=116603 RepID=A0A9P7DAL9_9AGAM|nr:uncharacterized protein HD556DRAFT_1449808 [Suillus plorans]XP_041158353.1 uncharacterized protein HD556DRAFT_1445176 [Suillus plorans]KAG1786308.1 hypothetical protein HD556DRAFT_1449808 [Suillus plorans]KAG1791547.1 hypothetical protein HD556DRAFT_1445176 [Suillus plorans]
MDSITRNACITGDLDTAEAWLTQRIDTDNSDHNAYANRSFVRARKDDWDGALHDALKSAAMPSLTGYLSSAIALCGNQRIQDAMKEFNLATMPNLSPTFLIHHGFQAIALFNAKQQHCEAIPHIQRPPDASPNADSLVCSIVEVYLDNLGGVCCNGLRGAGDFTAAVNTIAGSSESAICSEYEDFNVLFGCDLKLMWQNANQMRCDAFLQAGGIREALESYRHMMDMSGETTKANCLAWSTSKSSSIEHYTAKGFTDIVASGDAALKAGNYEEAIELYSAAINLGSASDTIFANRSKAKLEQRLWEDALLDAQQVIKLSPCNYLGYEMKHAVLRAAQYYDEAIEAFQVMLSILVNSSEKRQQDLFLEYASRSYIEVKIQKIVSDRIQHIPIRILDTSTGRLYDLKTRQEAFKTSVEYKELLSSITKRTDLQTERIKEVVVKYFGYVMLSHKWEGKEPLLCDIQGKSVYELESVGSVRKLQRFCETARDAGYRWAWSDTCCINKVDIEELPESITSMFRWYRHSALTVVYLSDISPSSGSGALVNSVWITRGWTLQEFLAPNIILFYRNDWTPYLDNPSDNHKEFIMQELKDVMGIDSRIHVTFSPGTEDPREKLVWASKRVTEKPEDIAYSLFGVFGVYSSVMYGEGKETDITSYGSTLLLPCPSKDEIQASISSLRIAEEEELALDLYNKLYDVDPVDFSNQRLYLPCIEFRVTKIKGRHDQDKKKNFTYDLKAKGLCDLSIITDEELHSSRENSTVPKLLLVRPWDCHLLELLDHSSDTESIDNISCFPSPSDNSSCPSSPSNSHDGLPGEDESLGSKSGEQALQLIAHLKQPFRAFLLMHKRGKEYTRIVSEYDIIARVEETTSIQNMTKWVKRVQVV